MDIKLNSKNKIGTNHYPYIIAEIGSNHNEISVTSREAQEVVPLLSSIYDEPFSDVSQIPSYLISKPEKPPPIWGPECPKRSYCALLSESDKTANASWISLNLSSAPGSEFLSG